MDMNAELSAQGLAQTTKYSTKILLALDSEQKQISEVIESQQSQEKKFDLLFAQLEKLNLAAKAGIGEGSSREASELVDEAESIDPNKMSLIKHPRYLIKRNVDN